MYSQSQEKDIVLKVIEFMKNRPYFYDESNSNFYNARKKYSEKQELGNSLCPPVAPEVISSKICYIVNKLMDTYNIYETGASSKQQDVWPFYAQSKFMLPALTTQKITINSISTSKNNRTQKFSKSNSPGDKENLEFVEVSDQAETPIFSSRATKRKHEVLESCEYLDEEIYDAPQHNDNETDDNIEDSYSQNDINAEIYHDNSQNEVDYSELTRSNAYFHCQICGLTSPIQDMRFHFKLKYHMKAEKGWKSKNKYRDIECPMCNIVFINWHPCFEHMLFYHNLFPNDINLKPFCINNKKLQIQMDEDNLEFETYPQLYLFELKNYDPSSQKNTIINDSNPENDNESDNEDTTVKKNIYKNYADKVFSTYTSTQFELHFRIPREVFNFLLRKLHENFDLIFMTKKAHFNEERKLLAVIWLLVTSDSYRYTSERFGMSKSSLYAAFTCIVKLFDIIANEFIEFPSNDRKKITKNHFQNIHKVNGIIGIIDCGVLPTRIVNVVESPNKFYESLIPMQFICDHKMNIINQFVGTSAFTNKKEVFEKSDFYQSVIKNENNYFESGEKLLAGELYPVKSWCMPPHRNDNCLTDNQILINKKYTSARMSFERCIYLLFGRFQRLRRICMDVTKSVPSMIKMACVIHNICLNMADEDLNVYVNEGKDVAKSFLDLGNQQYKNTGGNITKKIPLQTKNTKNKDYGITETQIEILDHKDMEENSFEEEYTKTEVLEIDNTDIVVEEENYTEEHVLDEYIEEYFVEDEEMSYTVYS